MNVAEQDKNRSRSHQRLIYTKGERCKKKEKKKKTKDNGKKTDQNKTRQLCSDTGNRTPVSRVTGGDTSHYTMSESIQTSKFINYKKIEQNYPGRTATQGKKRTTPGIPTWSPTVVLTGLDNA